MRIAKVFDSREGFAPDHPRIDDAAERERVAAFLGGGAMVLRTTGRTVDLLDPGRGNQVPLSFHTDGVWVWSMALGYYVAEHGMAPEPDFLAHIAACGYEAAMPDEAGRRAARDLLPKGRPFPR